MYNVVGETPATVEFSCKLFIFNVLQVFCFAKGYSI